MKFLEGKNPAERKKIITALLLGVVTVCALFYTFVLSGGNTRAKSGNANKNGNANRTTANSNSRSSNGATRISQIPPTSIDDTLLTPIPDNPFPPISDGAVSRNIFAFYEPPPATPRPIVIPTEKPVPPPAPAPTPPIMAAGVNPSMVYAQTGNFTLEIGGDKFTPDSRVYFGGMELQTQFTSPQRLTAQVPAQLVSSEGNREIIVRSPSDAKMFSNALAFNVQAPPVPEYSFVGLIARRRANNDTAVLQNKKSKEYINVRLNDPIPDRFRVFSISSKEVIVVDTALKLKHTLAYLSEGDAGKTGVTTSPTGRDALRGNRVQSPGFDPNVPNVQYQSIPGIPDNIPRYVPPQPVPPQPPQPQPPNKRNDQDEDDDEPKR